MDESRDLYDTTLELDDDNEDDEPEESEDNE